MRLKDAVRLEENVYPDQTVPESIVPVGIWCQNDVVSMSMRRLHVASTLIQVIFMSCARWGMICTGLDLNYILCHNDAVLTSMRRDVVLTSMRRHRPSLLFKLSCSITDQPK